MNLGLNLKIRKNGEGSDHRRTRTDYGNMKRLMDNFMKPNLPEPSARTTKCVYLGLKMKQKSMGTKYTHNRANNKSVYGENYNVTEYYEKPMTSRKSDISKMKVDVSFKKIVKNQSDAKQNINTRTTQVPLKGADRYEWDMKVGSGTFGTVHKARDKKTLETVAIKKVFQDPKYKNRQLEILKTLKHPNVLEMKEYFLTYQGNKQYLNIVMDYFPSNLYDYIQQTRGKRINKLKFKAIAFQLFKGLLYLKEKNIAHRDIKPQNILFKESDMKTLICDFGSAKLLVPGDQNISYICSRCYRAPELIFDNNEYTPQIDVWSMGCVLIQMVTSVPIFRANSNGEQLVEIIKVLGTPTPEQIIGMNPKCEVDNYMLPKLPKKDWIKILKTNILGEEFIDLLNKVMKYSPIQRLNPMQILQHSFFNQLKVQQIYEHLRKQLKIPQLFNFTSEFKSSKYDSLVPDWYKISSSTFN